MIISDVVLASGTAGFFYDDQQAIKKGAKSDGFTYVGLPITEGYKQIRQPAESISVMLILEDGQVAFGDCVSVQYSGVGGRDSLFIADDFIPFIREYIVPELKGKEITNFKDMAEKIDNLKIKGKKIHTAIRYGVTQAILDAVAKKNKITMAEVIKKEYDIDISFDRVPIYAQSGDERYSNVDKMVLKGVDVLPHGLINNVEEKVGKNGEILIEYITWVKERIYKLRLNKNYSPTLHLDVYGTLGLAFNNDMNKIADYLGELEKVATPLELTIESPIDMESTKEQYEGLKSLKTALRQKGINVKIVADEWCNSLEDIKLFADGKAVDKIQIKTPDLGGINNVVEALLYCREKEVGAFCGGSCTETDRSAQISANIAIACGAVQILAKPGMGVDEGLTIIKNEMNRVLALSKLRQR